MGRDRAKAKTRAPMRAEQGAFVPQEGMQPGTATRAFANILASVLGPSRPSTEPGWQRGSRSAKLQEAMKDAAAAKRARRRMLRQLAGADADADAEAEAEQEDAG
jgi:hypothetical protein